MNAVVRAVLAFAVVIAHAQCARTTSPASAVAAFYRTHLPNAQSGLLDAAELERLRGFLSEGLYRRYADAIRHQRDWMRRHPDEPSPNGGPPIIYKPPCVEGGDYFDGISDWPDVKSTVENPVERFEVVRTHIAGPPEAFRRPRVCGRCASVLLNPFSAAAP